MNAPLPITRANKTYDEILEGAEPTIEVGPIFHEAHKAGMEAEWYPFKFVYHITSYDENPKWNGRNATVIVYGEATYPNGKPEDDENPLECEYDLPFDEVFVKGVVENYALNQWYKNPKYSIGSGTWNDGNLWDEDEEKYEEENGDFNHFVKEYNKACKKPWKRWAPTKAHKNYMGQ